MVLIDKFLKAGKAETTPIIGLIRVASPCTSETRSGTRSIPRFGKSYDLPHRDAKLRAEVDPVGILGRNKVT